MSRRNYITDPQGKQIKEIAKEMDASVGWVTKVISSFLTTTASQVLRTFDEPLSVERVNRLAFDPSFYSIITDVLAETPDVSRHSEDKEMIDSPTHLNGSHSVKSRESEGY